MPGPMVIMKLFSVGSVSRENHLHDRFQDDNEILPKRPILDVGYVQLYSLQNLGIVPSFSTVTAYLCDSSNPWLNESSNSVGGHDLGESSIVDDHVRTRPNDAHFSPQYVDKLRNLIQASPSQPASKLVNALVISGGLP
jgi:hypothetical protein